MFKNYNRRDKILALVIFLVITLLIAYLIFLKLSQLPSTYIYSSPEEMVTKAQVGEKGALYSINSDIGTFTCSSTSDTMVECQWKSKKSGSLVRVLFPKGKGIFPQEDKALYVSVVEKQSNIVVTEILNIYNIPY